MTCPSCHGRGGHTTVDPCGRCSGSGQVDFAVDRCSCAECDRQRAEALEANRVRIDRELAIEHAQTMALVGRATRDATGWSYEEPTSFKISRCASYGWAKDGCPCARCYPPPALSPAGRVSLFTPRRWAFWTATAITIMAAKPFGAPWNGLPALWAITFSLFSLAIGHPWGAPRQFPGRPTLGRLGDPAEARKRLAPCGECACAGGAGLCRHGDRRNYPP